MIGHLATPSASCRIGCCASRAGTRRRCRGSMRTRSSPAAHAERRELGDLVAELAAVRVATLALVRSLDESALANRGMVNKWSLTARGLVFIIAGHFAHHVNMLRERYGVTV